jgi:LPXTG-motif cell wall-anchored protein
VYSGQCAAGTVSLATCGSVRFFEADSSGSIAYSMRVRRIIGSPSTDCQAAPGECTVFAASFEDVFATATVPLEFDPNAPPVPPPTLTVAPSSGLHDGDVVTVTGSGFTPGEQVAMLQCRGGPADETGGNCDIPGTLKYFPVDESGDLHAAFTVKRLLHTRNFADVDCVTDPNGCYLGWAGISDIQFERGNVPITFAPDPPVIVASGGLPATGAASKVLAVLGGGLCLLGALFLLVVRTRARPAIEWHPERDTPL